MATVPVYDGRKIQNAGAPNQFQQNHITPEALGGLEARALTQVGGQITQTGQQMMQIAQKEADAERVAEVQKRYAGDLMRVQDLAHKDITNPDGTVTKGWFNRVGEEAKGLLDEADRAFADLDKDTQGVENPGVRQALETKRLQLKLQYRDNLLRHDQSQAEALRKQSAQAAITAQSNEAVLGYSDPKKIELAEREIKANVAALNHGGDATAISNAQLKETSAMRLSVLDRMLTDSVPLAKAKRDEWREAGLLTADDVIKSEKVIDPKYKAWEYDALYTTLRNQSGSAGGQVARAMVTPSVAGGPMPSEDAQRLQPAIAKVESGGEPDPTRAISSAGAIGIMQIMPKTASYISSDIVKDGLISKSWSKEQIADFYASNPQVNVYHGTMYMDHLLKRYGGDVKTALIAYNGGPERADEWTSKGRDDSVLPEETRGYVVKVMGAMGEEVSGAPVESRSTLTDMPRLPPLEARIDADDPFPEGAFYSKQEVFKGRPGAFVNARAYTMANELGKRFFAQTGVKVDMNSGFRDPGTNAKVGGAKGSRHMHGDAFDFQIKGLNDEQKASFLALARDVGFTGYGFYEHGPGHLHLDLGKPRSWGSKPRWAQAVDFAQGTTGYIGQSSMSVGYGNLPMPANMARQASGRGQPFQAAMSMSNTAASWSPSAFQAQDQMSAPVVPAAPGAVPQMSYTINTDRTDWDAMRANAEAEPDPEKRMFLLRRISADAAAEESQTKKQAARISAALTREVMNGKRVEDLPPEAVGIIDQYNPRAIESLTRLQDSVEKRTDVTDPATFRKLWGMSDELLAQEDVTQYADKLSRSDLDAVIKRAGDAERKVDTEGAKPVKRIVEQTPMQLVEAAIMSDPILGALPQSTPTKRQPDTERRLGLFTQAAAAHIEAIAERKRAKGEKNPDVTPEEIKKELDRLLTPVTRAGRLSGETRLLFEVGTGDENARRNANALPLVGGNIEKFDGIDTVEGITERFGWEVAGKVSTLIKAATRSATNPDKSFVVQTFNDALMASTHRLVAPRGIVGQRWLQQMKADGHTWINDPRRVAKEYSEFLRENLKVQ